MTNINQKVIVNKHIQLTAINDTITAVNEKY